MCNKDKVGGREGERDSEGWGLKMGVVKEGNHKCYLCEGGGVTLFEL